MCSSAGRVSRTCASFSATRKSRLTWAVKVFEAATLTSRPARVKRTESTSRVICDPIMFVIATVRAPISRASFIAEIVSRVSPDCETPITSVFRSSTGLR